MSVAARARSYWTIPALLLAGIGVCFASAPSSPIQVRLSLEGLDASAASGEAIIEVVSHLDAPDTKVELILPPEATADETAWSVDLKAGEPVSFSAKWAFTGKPGNVAISARATRQTGPRSSWGDMKSIPIHVDPALGTASLEWKVDHVPVAGLAEQGDAALLSMAPTPFKFPDLSSAAPGAGPRPSVDPPSSPLDRGPKAPPEQTATVTLTGHWNIQDRSSVERAAQLQLIEVRRGDGSRIGGGIFCFTDQFGDFSCSLAHPGTSMRIWLWSWTNINPGPTLLGTFSGPEIAGGCGNDSIDCSYPVQTGELFCADGNTCNVGSWFVFNGGEPWGGAHQMTQDMVRSWLKVLFDNRHPGTVAGRGRITYPAPHGPHYHRAAPDDDWISIPAPYQTAADVVAHEYGHSVHRHLWETFIPNWPISDCPNPHFINGVSGQGCALSEGFADYWSWYTNEFYDGDNTAANDGPVYNDPGFSVDFETRDNGTFAAGDQVEGNVAAVMGDMLDAANDGPAPGTGAGDRLAEGLQHVWHIIASQSDNNFFEWHQAYIAAHDPGTAIEVMALNTINYGFVINDTCGNVLTAFSPASFLVNTVTATTDSTDPSVTCGNTSRERSVYFRWTAPGPGTVTVDTFGSDYDTILSAYTGGCGFFSNESCNDDAAPPERWSRVALGVSPGTTYTFMVSSYTGLGGNLRFNLLFTPAVPVHDECFGAKTVVVPPAPPYGDIDYTLGATEGAADPPTCGNGSNRRSVWYRFTAPNSGTLTADTLGSSYDTILSVDTGACTSLAPLTCNDDAGGTLQSIISATLSKGQTAWIKVSAYHGDGGKLNFRANFVADAGRVPDDWLTPGQPLDVYDVGGGQILLTWGASCTPSDNDYSVYEGTLGSWYTHYPVTCSTSGGPNYFHTPAPWSTYYLVVPHNGQQEGSYGLTAWGAERPPGFAQCYGQAIGNCPAPCAHATCDFGGPLDVGCSDCVAQICAVDPYCCAVGWDGTCIGEVMSVCRSLTCPGSQGSCSHTLCSAGAPLTSTCDDPPVSPSCVDQICFADPFCCSVSWDGTCVGEVGSVCGWNCN